MTYKIELCTALLCIEVVALQVWQGDDKVDEDEEEAEDDEDDDTTATRDGLLEFISADPALGSMNFTLSTS